jgi:hypothetical protein
MPPGTKGDDVFEDELEVDNDDAMADDNDQSGGGHGQTTAYQHV